MANHVSSLKRARQTVTRTAVNRANRSRVRTSLRALREASPRATSRPPRRSIARPSPPSTRACRRASSTQHRLPLQEPPQRSPKDPGHRQGVAFGWPVRPQSEIDVQERHGRESLGRICFVSISPASPIPKEWSSAVQEPWHIRRADEPGSFRSARGRRTPF